VTTISAVRGDLTRQPVDAIVNAANEWLAHGGGVAAAIVRAGGQVIQDESDAWVRANGPLSPGRAAVTSAGALAARMVVHIAGPRYREGADNEGLLRSAVSAALDAAAAAGAGSIAFPAVSAGIFGYPRAAACAVITAACRAWVEAHADRLEEIRLVGFDEATAADFSAALGSGTELTPDR
jgi:putative ATPase